MFIWKESNTDRFNLPMLPWRGTLAFLAYSSQEGLTGTNITWRGESHSGLVEKGRLATLASNFLTEKEKTRQSLPAMMNNAGEKINVPTSHLSSRYMSHFVKCVEGVRSMFMSEQHLTICLHSSLWGWRSSSPRSPRWRDGWWPDGLCRRHPSC